MKIVAVCALVALGNLARQRVQRLRAPIAAIAAAQASPVRAAAPANLMTWQPRITIRGDAFDETTVTIPAPVR